MDLSTITDVKELKALAYDQTVQLQVAQQNLQMIQQRISQLETPGEEVEATPEAEVVEEPRFDDPKKR